MHASRIKNVSLYIANELELDDSEKKHAFTEGEALTPEETLTRIHAFGCPLVEFTGGEPLP